MMNSYTTYKVIKVIDEYSLVINGGLNDDISLEDSIEIYLQGDEVVDPFKENKVLGTLDFIKDTLEVTEVYSDFAVCKKIVKEKVYRSSAFQKAFSSAGGVLGGTTETTTRVEKINVAKSEITGRKTGDNVIRIGDVARIALK
jgi:hypothetical protein